MYAIGAISGKASGTLPSWNKQKVENLFFCSLRESQNRPPKNWAKKRVRMTLNFFISRTFFSCPPRQSTPLGRFRGGRATQKVAQTKTPMEREVSKSLERVKILTERPFSRSINSTRLPFVNGNADLRYFSFFLNFCLMFDSWPPPQNCPPQKMSSLHGTLLEVYEGSFFSTDIRGFGVYHYAYCIVYIRK